MGFKTFGEFWDESYDDELDHTKRFEKIIDIVKDIASWDDAKMEDFSRKVKPVLDYNFMRISIIPNIEIDALVDKYGV
jgi:hypothetical protein